MCDPSYETTNHGTKIIHVQKSIGTILSHDITESRSEVCKYPICPFGKGE
jgi:hypothetical protein